MEKKALIFMITICLLLMMIAAVVIVALRYMQEEPWWNREPTPIVNETPDAARLDELGQNRPPGDGVTPEQNDTPKGD